MNRPTLLAAAVLAVSTVVAARQQPAPTHIVRFTPPAHLPDRVKHGECEGASVAADYRNDAYRCTAAGTTYDPCFLTAHPDRVLCDVDPRDPASGVQIAVATPVPRPAGTWSGAARAWFFELTDGTTCRPLLSGNRREVGGLLEVYTCRFGSVGDADAVLGELDASASVWTVQKTLINKKIDPPTVKSAIAAAVKAVWQ